MAKFEVFIPASGPEGRDMTLKVQAENWLAALNTGMKKIGEKGGAGSNVMVDIQDDESIHVTDPKSGRVFRIKEIEIEEEPKQEATQINIPNPFAEPPPNPFDPRPARPRTSPQLKSAPKAPAPEPTTSEQASPFAAVEPTPAIVPAAKSKPPAPAPFSNTRPPTAPPGGRAAPTRPPSRGAPSVTAAEKPLPPRPKPPRSPSSVAMNVEEVVRTEQRPAAGRIGRERAVAPENVDDTLAELFERTQELEEYEDPEEALYFVLDLAMDKIAADSGAVFLADLSSNELNVGAARGPKSKELLKLNPRVPMGVGIVGFSAQESVSLALSDVHRDPRFFKAISQRLGYETRSILCSPMMLNGRCFGCLEVLNKRSNSRFTEGELAILSYLADRGARYLETVG